MKKQAILLVFVGFIIGLILGTILGLCFFDKKYEGFQKVHYYCKIDLSKIGCANSYDCISVNGLCDLNTFRCVKPDIDFDLYFSGNETDCLKIGGDWRLGLGG